MAGQGATVFSAPSRDPSHTLVAFERRAFFDRIVWHGHTDIELTLVLEGRGARGLGGRVERYEAGDLCLLGAGCAHGWQSGRDVRALVVHFPRALLGVSESMGEMRMAADLLRRARDGLVIAGSTRDAVAREIERLHAAPDGSWRRPLALLGALATMASGGTDLRLFPSPPGRGTPDVRMLRVLAYVDGSVADGVSQREAAACAGLSPSAFSRFFRRQTGRTFEVHVDEVRLALARRALLDGDAPVTEVALGAGFGSIGHFNRRFRRATGLSPSAYRARRGQ